MNCYYRPIAAQFAVFCITAIAIGLTWRQGLVAWVSGSSVIMICNLWFTFRSKPAGNIRSSRAFLASTNRGIVEKFMLATSGFAVIFVTIDPHTPLLVFVSSAIMIATQFVASALLSRRLD